MGLFAYLKNKFAKKEETPAGEKYEKGLAKSRAAFASRLEELSKRYKEVNADYFEELEQILIEADVGVSFTLAWSRASWTNPKKKGSRIPARSMRP
jgi:fused signal recognition particle receptor